MSENSTTLSLIQHKKEIQKTLSYFDLKIIRNPLKKSIMHSQLLHRDLVRNFDHLGVPMHVLTFLRMVEDLNYDNLVEFSQSAFAEEQGTTIQHIAGCLRRLQKSLFVIRLWDPSNKKRRVKIWMINPNVVFRGSGMNYQRALDNFSALADGRFEDTEFSRDRSESGSIRNNIPWLQGSFDIDEKDDIEKADPLRGEESKQA